MRTLILILFIGVLFSSKGQSLSYGGPVSLSMSSIRSFDQSAWAVYGNISSLATIENLTVGAAYELRFNMEELSSRAITGIWPTKYGAFSLLIFQSGYSKSNFNRYAIAYSRAFGEKVQAGFQLNYLSHHLYQADNTASYFSTFSLTVHASSAISFAINIQNVEQANLSYDVEQYKLPTLFNGGIQWKSGNRFRIVLEMEKELDLEIVYKTGMELNFNDQVQIRGGVKSQPVELSVGSGVKWKGVSIDAAIAHHQQLGITSGVGLSYAFQIKKN